MPLFLDLGRQHAAGSIDHAHFIPALNSIKDHLADGFCCLNTLLQSAVIDQNRIKRAPQFLIAVQKSSTNFGRVIFAIFDAEYANYGVKLALIGKCHQFFTSSLLKNPLATAGTW